MPKRALKDYSEANAAIERLMESVPSNDDDCFARWDDSEQVVDDFINAVQTRSANFPSREKLGEACFWLSFFAGSWDLPSHRNLVCELLTPSRGMEMFSLLPRVRIFKAEVELSLPKSAEERKGAERQRALSDDDIPF